MQIEIITYHVASGNPKPGFEWTAYVVPPNGEYWGVRFNGPTEEIARSKAIALWTSERAKVKQREPEEAPVDPWSTDDAPSGRGHHFAGKVWMRNNEGLKRVAMTEIALYEKNGYWRSGPRSK